ncbi:DUF1523 family protein [Thalassorhabdomicrobium marinisediminis]|uniref:DUF1523 domain-containing protein n=1 Tax=Thalassorhabdomicrobium marinisediminis TaxID=2170577 RepID=A0A2T7FZE2_9RHOB|nr:DUF1523 family protein [Thalassorhabdomicrobium marinisediminis]PVA07544.1 DUF1523 domain-containing protein [Thalassorhabdomicrobium marinisediminis]
MRNIRRVFRIVLFVVFGLVLHYALPQHDVVRVVNTYQERQDLNDWTRVFWARPDDQSAELINRDVQFIQTVKRKTWLLGFIPRDATEVMVYRNEDTGWSWPFYFKFDTANLQTEADDLVSTSETPKWAVMTHYGWRNEYLSAFPNAIAIRPVTGPDVTIIPWFNIGFFVVLILAFLFLRAVWQQFRERTLDPLADRAGDQMDHVSADLAERRSRWSRWMDSWRSKK